MIARSFMHDDGIHNLVYRRHQLLALRAALGSKSTSYVGHLAALSLLRYRGNRAGVSIQRQRSRASVYQHDPHNQLGQVSDVYCLSDRCCDDVQRPCDCILAPIKCVADDERSLEVSNHDVRSLSNTNARRLHHADCDHRRVVWHTVCRTTLPLPFNAGVFNSRSVHNKSRSITDWIVSSKLSVVTALKLSDILSAHSLMQHISQPTHIRRHTLDVLITRHYQAVSSVSIDPPALSDHSMIVANVNLHAPLEPGCHASRSVQLAITGRGQVR